MDAPEQFHRLLEKLLLKQKKYWTKKVLIL